MGISPKLYYKLTFLILAMFLAGNSVANCYLVGSDVRKPFANRTACENELRTANRAWRQLGESGGSGLSCICPNSTTNSNPGYQRDYQAEQREAQRQAEQERIIKAEEEKKLNAFNADKQETLNNLKRLDGGKIFDGSQTSSDSVGSLKSLDTMPMSNSTSGLKSLSALKPNASQITTRQKTDNITITCSAAIKASNEDLQQFVKRAEENGYNFTKQEFTSNLKDLSKENILKMTDSEYSALYKTTKNNIDYFKTTQGYLKQLSDCVDNTQCDLLIMAKQLSNELYEWIQAMTNDRISKPSDRVKKASNFYTNYLDKLAKSSQKNITKAAQCL